MKENLYDMAKAITNNAGLPWTDPRTGITHPPPFSLKTPTAIDKTRSIDINSPRIVEVGIRRDGKVVWINVDGLLRLRASQVKSIVIRDSRKGGKSPRRKK